MVVHLQDSKTALTCTVSFFSQHAFPTFLSKFISVPIIAVKMLLEKKNRSCLICTKFLFGTVENS